MLPAQNGKSLTDLPPVSAWRNDYLTFLLERLTLSTNSIDSADELITVTILISILKKKEEKKQDCETVLRNAGKRA